MCHLNFFSAPVHSDCQRPYANCSELIPSSRGMKPNAEGNQHVGSVEAEGRSESRTSWGFLLEP